MTKAIYAGSFDPLTNGHMWVIEQGAGTFDELVVAVGINPDKASSYAFSIEDRVEMVGEAVRHLPNVSVAEMGKAFLIRFANDKHATHIFRGMRSAKDFDDENQLFLGSHQLEPSSGIKWAYALYDPSTSPVSSSFVKGLVGYA